MQKLHGWVRFSSLRRNRCPPETQLKISPLNDAETNYFFLFFYLHGGGCDELLPAALKTGKMEQEAGS